MRKINGVALHLPRWALVLAVAGCDAAKVTQPLDPPARMAPAGLRLYEGYGYRIASQIWPEEDLIFAANQNDEEGDGKIFRCPDQDVVTKTWRFTVEMEPDYLAHFEFGGPKYFIRYNRTLSAAGALPVADFRYIEPSTDQNGKYVAQAPGIISIACRGTYIRVPAGRVWVGNYWTLAHEGTIALNPNFSGGAGGDCEGTEEMSELSYSPYEDGTRDNPEESCAGGGGGGSGEGSGIQYEPGDYTGGETVDWNTGTGNGGTSVCGQDARVELICIDYWVEGTGWVEWSCGYATTC